METGTIATRYAKALWAYALECKAEEEIYPQMLSLCRSLVQVKELQRALLNPAINRTTKFALLAQASGVEHLHPVSHRFLSLVFDQRRERYLLFIIASFIAHYRHAKGLYVGKLTTAVPLDEATLDLLKQMIAKSIQGTVEFDVRVDNDLIGGFILQLDNLRMDASVKGQLKQIAEEWKGW